MAARPLWRNLLMLSVLGVCGLFSGSSAHAAALRLPITIDYPLLQSLIIRQAYRGPGETAQVLDLQDGCNSVVLSRPHIRHERNLVRFQTRVSLNAGTPVGGYCVAPLSWEGQLVLWQQPSVDAGWQLRFTPVDSMLLDLEGQPAQLAGLLWDLVKTQAHVYLSNIRINLAPPVKDLKAFLLPLFDTQSQTDARRFLDSMRPGGVQIDSSALKVDISAQIPDPPKAPVQSQRLTQEDEAATSPEELERVMALWETWDAVLVHMVLELFGEPLTPEEQQILLDTLLAVRYEFSEQLAAKGLTTGFIRSQFIEAWQQIRPVFRRHLGDDPAKSVLGYLAFFTAADALAALDQVGPVMGIEISRDGFLRLVRLLSDQPLEQLEQPGALNPRLRDILGLGEPLEPPAEEAQPDPPSPPPAEEPDSPQSRRQPLPQGHDGAFWRFGGLAWAGDNSAAKAGTRYLRRWTAPAGAGEAFVKRVVKVLEGASRQAGSKKKFSRARRKWFNAMVLATAWQESCFRQFHIRKGKIVYLLSYNNTSVGLMQINERVWKGIYDQNRLRWDIHYNAGAGAEILALYLQRYILKQDKTAWGTAQKDQRFLAGWLYALYNGGPRQLKHYPQRQKAGKLYRSDRLLLEKYDQVTGHTRWITQVTCLPQG